MIAILGSAWAFWADAANFAFGLASLLALRLGRGEHPPRTSLLSDVREGLSFTKAQTWLWVSLVVTAASNFFLSGPVAGGDPGPGEGTAA